MWSCRGDNRWVIPARGFLKCSSSQSVSQYLRSDNGKEKKTPQSISYAHTRAIGTAGTGTPLNLPAGTVAVKTSLLLYLQVNTNTKFPFVSLILQANVV